MTDSAPVGFVPATARPCLLRILALEHQIETTRSGRMVRALPHILRALEITTNGYRKNSLTSGQLQDLERCEIALQDLIK